MSSLIQVKGLQRSFSVNAGMFRARRLLHAVNGIDISVERGDVAAANRRSRACCWG
jgi:peptide/nickel transport system ATP-binding protein